MSERGQFRGGRAHGGGGQRGRGGGGRGGAQTGHQQEKPKKESILDLSKYMDKQVTVKFSGGREGMFVLQYSASYNLPICSDWNS